MSLRGGGLKPPIDEAKPNGLLRQILSDLGGGVHWGDFGPCLFCAVARFFRPGYLNNLVSTWLPALDGVVAKLRDGGRVADVGCGHGWSTVLMAQAFPKSRFMGCDFHASSIERARRHAAEHGVTNGQFEVGTAKTYPANDMDLVTFFDCLHDMGDPAGAAAHVKQSLKPDGTWMVVEPMAGDRMEDNLNPIGRIYFAASTLVCVPTSLAAGCRRRHGHTGGRGKTAGGDHDGRLPVGAARRGDAVQHGA